MVRVLSLLIHPYLFVYSDMEDRIDMRSSIKSGLGWSVPPLLAKADWQDWREKSDKDSTVDVNAFYSAASSEVLRSMRGFVCKNSLYSRRSRNGSHL